MTHARGMASRLRLGLYLFVAEALRALGRNRGRSALSALGISIGIAAVVWVVAIGKAGADRAEAQLQNLGDNLVWVEAGSRNRSGVRTGARSVTTLTLGDAEAIAREIPLIKKVSPNVDGHIQIVYGNRNWATHYRGVTPAYLDIKRWDVARGAAFTAEDDLRATAVCLLGQTVSDELFGSEDPLGKLVRIGTNFFQVAGVLAPKGQAATGQDQDDNVLVPYRTAQRLLRDKGFEYLDDIMCSAVSPEAVALAADEISALMRQRHRITAGRDDDFNIRRPEELIKAQIEASRTLALLLISMASVSLVVGGVGIMNVMLASVVQRTKEIGVRLAVGAPRWAIQVQFLGEAVLLSLAGALLGIALCYGGTFFLVQVLEWSITIPPAAVAFAVVFAACVGVSFGFYPARTAARMDPIAALQHE
jgi:putative ABC transport system permease protein